MRALNLGIVAHVDAGKTTLTERLLYAAGVIDEIGSVDAGTTQTDSLALERQRGITIKAAVVSFVVDGVTVNLIDTPGHPDFIAEVDRTLAVLDGAVLVVSAVEGVQPQTRILMRALQRLNVPTVIFVNKIDRPGARGHALLADIADRLQVDCVPMGQTHYLGTPRAGFTASPVTDGGAGAELLDVLADHDDSLFAEYLDHGAPPPPERLWEHLTAQTRRSAVHPVFFGSALTGAGVEELRQGTVWLLTPDERDCNGSLSGLIFKIDRTPAGEGVAYAAILSGTLRERQPVPVGTRERQRTPKATGIEVFEAGSAVARESISAGQIGKLKGLAGARIGDGIGHVAQRAVTPEFPPPALEAIVSARHPAQGARLRHALLQLAEQDPLINVRQDDVGGEVSVSLYGEVQKEVIGATLAADYGIEAEFSEATTVYIERPVGTGTHVELLQADDHPFSATVGLRIDPAPAGSGVEFRLAIDPDLVPLYIYKTAAKFVEAMTGYVQGALAEGRAGWQVTDCQVTMTHCGYYIGDGPGKPSRPTGRTTAAHFRHLTPIVLAAALDQAGTDVCQPMIQARVETPTTSLGAVLTQIARLGGTVQDQHTVGDFTTLVSLLPAAPAQQLRRHLPGITSGEGSMETSFGGYRPAPGRPPRRPRTTPDPRRRREYLTAVAGHP